MAESTDQNASICPKLATEPSHVRRPSEELVRILLALDPDDDTQHCT
jgi:hypothetical protein